MATVPARGAGMGTGVNAAAGPLIASIASTVSASPLLVIRFISSFLSRSPWLRLLGVLIRYGWAVGTVFGSRADAQARGRGGRQR